MTDQGRGQIVVYRTTNGEVRVDVRLERDSVWLSLDQMAALFERHKSVVSRHLRSVFASGELDRSSVVARNATTAADGKTYQVDYYDLDAIISVGYRVNSKRGTQFRIWATRTLREHIVRGYTLNQVRLHEHGLKEIEQALELMARTLSTNELVTDQGRAVLDIVRQYTRSWRLLLEYDERRLPSRPAEPALPAPPLTLDEARVAIEKLREDASQRGAAAGLFGRERGDGLAAALGAVVQTFNGDPLYPSAQVRAAHLLYFIIKDHPFADGNKRIGVLLFLETLRRSGLLDAPDGRPRLADNAVVALALLIAESEPSQKDLMIRLTLSLIDGGK